MKTFIIAEAGVNHNGSMKLAMKLVDVAVEAGVDAVKFQTFRAERMISKFARKAEYQCNTSGKSETQLEMVKRLELDVTEHEELMGYCRGKGIMFLSTPFDLESIELLNGIGVEIFKIPSGEITNLPYLRRIGELKRKKILSTGMAEMGEIENALDILQEAGTPKDSIVVLHCNTEYPTPMEDVNLKAMLTIRDTFGVNVGYSDHTSGIEVPIAAVALGATVIEKHFTLDKNMDGPDHSASLDRVELERMVTAIRNMEKAMGDGIKRPSSSELRNKPVVRKSIVAARDINKGDIFTEDNITVKRPGTGISPMEWDSIIGRNAIRSFNEDELIEL
jgi:N,N'-diacetyllegionaminate synthase